MKTFRNMAPARLNELLGRFSQLRIVVVGDYFLDKYLDIDPALAEVSVETGKTAHQVVGIRHSPGAAGTVVCNLAALGTGTIFAVGFTGNDGEAFDLRRGLDVLGCDTEHLHRDGHRHTPTYLKPRDHHDASLAGEHSRYDTKNRTPTSEETQQRIIDSLEHLLAGSHPDHDSGAPSPRRTVDAVIIADQVEEDQCGVITERVRAYLADAAKRHKEVIFWADSRRRIHAFRHVIIKPNQFEAVGHADPLPGDEVDMARLETAIAELRCAISAPVCATRGAQGMVVSDPEVIAVPGVPVTGPVDPTGAGDSATAGAVLALAAGASLAEAAVVGNLVASITVQQLATTGTARPEQLPGQLARWQQNA